jgi:hypothetical protein
LEYTTGPVKAQADSGVATLRRLPEWRLFLLN